MAENFDLIFGQNASQQYAWSDNDYQNGWETIGSIPPTAAQFDALQRHADMKSQNLNSRLIAVEQYIKEGNKREPNTEYTVGTVLTYDGLPMDWVLECIVGGISSANDITLPSPRVEGARILDGTVTWALRKIATYGGIGYRQSSTPYYTGSIAFSTSLPAGLYLDCTAAGTTGSGDLVVTRKNVGEIVTDGTVTWTVRKFADTTDATTTTNGLMSASDKVKLDGIEANANHYSLPAATGSTRGGVTVGPNISLSGDTISILSSNVQNALGFNPATRDVVTGSTNGLMTPAMLALLDSSGIVAASLTTNGYIKFANGFIMQWGSGGCSDAGIAFPIAFPNQCFGVVATRKEATHGDILQPNVESFTTQRAFIKLGSAGAGHEFYGTLYVTIYAIGK